MDKIMGAAGSLRTLTGTPNDDWCDRLNHIWTVALLGMFTIFTTTSQFVGKPIECWCPAEFKDFWVDYTKSLCWVSNTYYINMEDTIPVAIPERESEQIHYYQWVPIILLFMAFMFKMPNIIWRLFNDISGVNLDKIVVLSEASQLGSPDDRRKTVKHIATYMDRWLCTHKRPNMKFMANARQRMNKIFFFVCNKDQGTFITGFYLLVKLFYVANVVGQFFLLNAFLAIDYSLYGVEIVEHMTTHGNLRESARFPRVTLCDFQIRQLQNLLRYTVQCVLPINLFNEKIFAFIWFWLVLVAVISCASLLFWLYRIYFRQNRVRFVKRYLKIAEASNSDSAEKSLMDEKEDEKPKDKPDSSYDKRKDKQLAFKFGNEYLKDDGVFVLRVVGKNSTDLVVTDLLKKLWEMFKNKDENKRYLYDDLEDSNP